MEDENTTDATSASNDDLDAKIEAAVKAATKKLEAKNSELRNEKKRLQDQLSNTESEAEEARTEAATASGDIEKIKADLQAKHDKALAKLQADRDAAHGQLNTLLIDNAISKNLVDGNVAKHMHDPLTAMFKSQAEVRDGVAYFGDNELNEHISEYLKSDSGKPFVLAPENVGGGATGSTGRGSTGGWTKDNFSSREDEWMMLSVSDPQTAKAIAQNVGREDLASTL